MEMNYCMHCGTRLEERFLENEGMIPYCPTCREYRFPVFNTAVSMVVMNQTRDRILLIKQYGGTEYILVAGYVNKGEDAEHAVIREVREETGLEVTGLEFNKSAYFGGSNTLMLNFSCTVADEALDGVTDEVDVATWFTVEQARANIRQKSLAQKFLEHYVQHHLTKEN